ncbi:hypothetical protein D3C87_1516070 [compost metagenome]
MVKVDFKAELVAVVRRKAGPLGGCALAFAHLHGPQDANKTLGGVLQLHPRALQQKDKRCGRAIKDGDFFGRDVHVQVVDAQPCTGRHQMLHRVHLGIAHRDGGGQPGVGNRLGADRNVHRLGQVHPPKHDAGVRLCGPQGQLDPLAAVQPDAYGAGQCLEGALLEHGAF